MIDFVKEFFDGYIDYFTPEHQIRYKNHLRPPRIVRHSKIVKYNSDEAHAVNALRLSEFKEDERSEIEIFVSSSKIKRQRDADIIFTPLYMFVLYKKKKT